MSNRFLVFLASLLLCVLALSLSAAEVAKVGDTVITTDEVRQTIARNGYYIYDEASVKKGLEDAVEFELLAEQAKKLGLDTQPAVAKQIKELLVQKLLAEKVDAPLSALHFSDEELRAWYEVHTNDFRKGALARGTVLTLLVEQGKEAEARARAAEALKELQAVSEPLVGNRPPPVGNSAHAAAIVRKYSDDPSEKLNGGMSSYFAEGQQSRRYPQAVADAMLQLQLRGEIAGPIATPRALYVIQLTERREAQLTPFEQARGEVQKRLVRERRQKALAEYCAELKKEFPVAVDESELKSVVQPSRPGGGPPSVPGGMP
ncbi:MAG: peptidyl-prolyl cis-trans isomerase [Limisphaerales bacterium]